MSNARCKGAVAAACLALSTGAWADLQPISERAMGEIHGQAVLDVDIRDMGAERFTRATLGMDIESQTKVNRLTIGGTDDGSDIQIDNVSFGNISDDPDKVQIDGQQHAVNELVPFEGISPYIELAEKDGQLIGFRFGFNQARGTLSGDITSFSGNLGLEIEDGEGNVSPATLFNADGVATTNRATHIGLNDPATDCASGVQCAPLLNLKTFDIGSRNEDGTTGYAQNLFLAFQKQAISWETNGSAPAVEAGRGVYFNVPTSMRLKLGTLQNETVIPRTNTGYVETGEGMF